MTKVARPLLVAMAFALSLCRPAGPDPMPRPQPDSTRPDTPATVAARSHTLLTGLKPGDTVGLGTGLPTSGSPGFDQIFGPVQDSIRYPLPRITMQFAISAYRRPEGQAPWRQMFGFQLVAGRWLGDEFCVLFEKVSYSWYQGQLRPGRYKDFVPYLSDAGYWDCDVNDGTCRHLDTASYIQVHAVDLAQRKVRISYDLRYYRLPSEVSPRNRHLPMSYRFTQTEPIVVRLVQ